MIFKDCFPHSKLLLRCQSTLPGTGCLSKKDDAAFSPEGVKEQLLLWAGLGNVSHLVLQVMEGVAQSGRGGNPSLENIPKPPVLSLPPVWKFLPMTQCSGMLHKHTQSSGYRDTVALYIPPRI